jgi:hypothetical protein
MDPPPEYRALSYVWGDPSATKVILVDNTPFKVRINLWNYLVQARREEMCTLDARYIWVDAVCINQNDLDERSKQVAIMGQIYSKASEVYAWLGVGTEKNLEAMRDLAETDCKAKSANAIWEVLSFADEQLESICALFELEYWSRLWIVQEYVLANSIVVQCGPRIVSGVQLDRMTSAVLSNRIDSPNKELSGTRAWRILFARQRRHDQDRFSPGFSFQFALILSLDSHCTQLHDHVYALISVSDNAPGKIVPDYSKSLLQLFLEVTSFLQSEGDSFVGHRYSAEIGRTLQEKLGLHECEEATQALRRLEFHDQSGMGDLQDRGNYSSLTRIMDYYDGESFEEECFGLLRDQADRLAEESFW